MILWQNVKPEFKGDGSLRDIYVTPADMEDWRRFYRLLKDFPGGEFSVDEVPSIPPSTVEDVFALRPTSHPMFRVSVGGVLVVIHFFNTEELEADFVPNEVVSEDKFVALLEFVRQVGNAVQKPVLITPENCRSHPFIIYSPATREFQHQSVG